MAPSNAPSFFKVLVDPSAPNLPLPPDFVTMHFKNNIPYDPIIQSLNGEHVWGVKIKKVGEVYCFDHGWNNVVKDAAMGYGDFIVFWLADACTFKMLACSPNGCEKDLPPKVKVEDYDVNDDDDDPMFKTALIKSHESILNGLAPYFGCTVGRVTNTDIERKFTLNGIDYTLLIHSGPDSVHGMYVVVNELITFQISRKS
nr:DNA-binding pseudobarrel domain-containing protein [Tanacetum cinerariifolium]